MTMTMTMTMTMVLPNQKRTYTLGINLNPNLRVVFLIKASVGHFARKGRKARMIARKFAPLTNALKFLEKFSLELLCLLKRQVEAAPLTCVRGENASKLGPFGHLGQQLTLLTVLLGHRLMTTVSISPRQMSPQ